MLSPKEEKNVRCQISKLVKIQKHSNSVCLRRLCWNLAHFFFTSMCISTTSFSVPFLVVLAQWLINHWKRHFVLSLEKCMLATTVFDSMYLASLKAHCAHLWRHGSNSSFLIAIQIWSQLAHAFADDSSRVRALSDPRIRVQCFDLRLVFLGP